MSSKLIIRLCPSFLEESEESKELDWLYVSSDQQIESGKDPLSAIPKRSDDDLFVIILVSAEDVLVSQIDLPKVKKGSQLKKMVPFAMEEHLVTDISNVHIIYQEAENNKLNVAVVDHKKMQAWIERLEAAGWSPDVLIPDFLSLPIESGRWMVWVEKEQALVKTSEGQGFTIDLGNLSMGLEAKVNEVVNSNPEGAEALMPKVIECFFADEALFKEYEKSLDALSNVCPIETKVVKKSFLSFVERELSSKNDFLNLLRPPYAKKRKWGKLKKAWYPVLVLLAIWLGLVFFKMTTQFLYFKRQSVVLEKQGIQLYQQAFPGEKKLPSKKRLEKLLARIALIAKGDVFLESLRKFGAKLQNHSVMLTAMNYRAQTFTLKMESSNADNFKKLLEEFSKSGLKVKEKATSDLEGKFTAEWEIKV